MDQREEFFRSSRIQKTNEARSSYGRKQQATTVNEYIPSFMSVINSRANFKGGVLVVNAQYIRCTQDWDTGCSTGTR